MATVKGHMHQTCNNIKSTKQQETMRKEEPSTTPLTQHTNKVFTNIINHKMQIDTYLTRKFPVTLNTISIYLYYMIKIDNIILIRPMKARSDSELIRVFKDLYEHLLTSGTNPAHMRLDNESYPYSKG